MAEENLAGQSWPPNPQTGSGQVPQAGGEKPLSTGEGEAPLVPKIDLRTMASDLGSIKESGGGPPRPYVPPPPTFNKPEEPVGAASPPFEPPKIGETAPVQFPAGVPLEGKPKSKGLFVVILAVIIIVGLGAIGYFFVYPYFFKQSKEEAVEAPPPTPKEEAPAPILPAVPTIPEAELSPPGEEAATTTETSPIETPPPPLTTPSHVSLFKKAADASSEVNLAALDLTSLKQAWGSETAEVPVLKELVVKENEALVGSADLLKILLPTLFGEGPNLFEDDFSLFVYVKANGTWPGFILKKKSDAESAQITSRLTALEATNEIVNLYVSDPGTPSGVWKNGSTSGISNRYTTFSKAGYALNYGWVGDLLVFSASYDGFKEAVKRLQ